MNPTPPDEAPESPTAKGYMLEHRGKVMVLQRAEGVAAQDTDFCTVESVGSHPTGLVITAVFAHSRRQRLRPAEIRRATDLEIASQNV